MNAVAETTSAPPLIKLREQFESREDSFKAALPAHIPVERFMRVVLTATQRNPDLVTADRSSLFNSALLAAQDGLLPDGREGALVIYNTKVKKGGKDEWVKAVQWMPMIAGILKKCRNSGELSSIEAHTVHANDKFAYRIGIDEQPVHEPDWFGDRGAVVGVYAVAKLKDGSRVSEIMSHREVESVRAVSRAKDSGPWTQWWGEMARKTVLRRLSKRLPISTDLDDLIRRDDALYDFEGAKADAQRAAPRSLAGKLDALANPAPRNAPQIEHQPDTPHDPDTGEITATSGVQPRGHSRASTEAAMAADETAGADTGQQQHGEVADTGASPSDTEEQQSPTAYAWERGREAKESGLGTRAMPGEYRMAGREEEAAAWMEGHRAGTKAED